MKLVAALLVVGERTDSATARATAPAILLVIIERGLMRMGWAMVSTSASDTGTAWDFPSVWA